MSLRPKKPAELADATPARKRAIVKEKAITLLAAREHGREELRSKLLMREMPADIVSSVLDELNQEGLQCDSRYAEAFTRMRIQRGGGANKIRAELQARRISKFEIEAALRDSETDWTELAVQALRKKFRAGDGNDIARMQRFLAGRGFESEHIVAAIAALEA